MKFNADMALIEAAREIGPTIRAHNEQAERERRLSRPVLNALYEAGLLRMSTPRSLGGLEADPITRALVIEEVSTHDTAAGWTLANPLDWAHFCARLPDAGAEEIYSQGADVLIAAQFGRPLSAVPTEGGYRISGRASFVSNCYDADWIAVTAKVQGEQQSAEDAPEMVMVYVPRENCEVIDTWDVMGMRGTGSNDVSVTDAFVPTSRSFPMVPDFEPGSHYQGPLYRVPVVAYVATNIPPVMLAVARKAIDEVSALAQSKTPVGSTTLLKERSSAQFKLAEAEGILRAGRLFLFDTLNTVWEACLAGERHSIRARADMLLAMTYSANSAVRAVELACSVAGTSGFRATSPLERYFRDVQVLKHHTFVTESRYETVGQVYLASLRTSQ